MTFLLETTELTATQFAICVVAIFLAGMVRGFSGFGLSAMVMAMLVTMIAPIRLIVVCWFLEMAASLLMVRGGVRDADMKMVFGLFIGSVVGTPAGLYLTNSWPVETSKKAALFLVIGLALMQLLRVRPSFLATTPGLYFSGLTAGIATGLASVGGMVVALYVLARNASADVMRASLVMFLFIGSLTSIVYHWLYGMVILPVVLQGLIFAPVCMLGVVAGQAMFRPRLQPYYKPFCLVLLLGLAGAGLIRMALQGQAV